MADQSFNQDAEQQGGEDTTALMEDLFDKL